MVGFGGVADTPIVREWPRLSAGDLGDALAELSGEIDVIGDEGADTEYRRGLIRSLGRRAVARAATGPPADAPAPKARVRGGSAEAPGRIRRLRAGERHRVELTLNGRRCVGEAPPRMLLSDFLRRESGLRGVHVGCEHGVCGACTVRVDGAPARACLMFAVQACGRSVDTVEGLAGPDGRLAPLQEAFRRHHALQCGYCTPGILMTMTEWLERLAEEGRAPDTAEVRAVLSGHLCRCTGYEPIVAAVLDAAGEAVAAHRCSLVHEPACDGP